MSNRWMSKRRLREELEATQRFFIKEMDEHDRLKKDARRNGTNLELRKVEALESIAQSLGEIKRNTHAIRQEMMASRRMAEDQVAKTEAAINGVEEMAVEMHTNLNPEAPKFRCKNCDKEIYWTANNEWRHKEHYLKQCKYNRSPFAEPA